MTLQTGQKSVLAWLLLPSLAVLGCGPGGNSPAVVQTLPTITSKSGVTMVVVPAGSFEMGSQHGREELARGRIDDFDGIRKFCGHVQQTVGPEFGAVRAEGFAQVDRGSEFAFLQINHVNRAAVRPWFSDTGVSVDRNVSEAAVFRHNDFVAVHSHRNFC